jgi:DNA-binding transcriptional LysR family regulator
MAQAPELRQLRHFVAVAEHLNFTRAAADLSIAQQGLSSSIRQLEATLGARVFERSTREVRLTAAGQALLPEARRTVAQADRAVEAVRRAARGEADELRVGYVPAGGVDLVRRVVAPFCAEHPEVRVSARELWASEIAAALRDRSLDVGFTRFTSDGDGIRSEVVAEDEVVAVLPRAHPLAAAAEIDLGALRDETLLVRPRSAMYNALILDACREAGFDPPTLESPIVGNVGFFEPVAAGRAFALVAVPVAKRWADERMATVRLRQPGRRLPMRILWPADGAGPLAERLVAVAREIRRAERAPRPRASAAA